MKITRQSILATLRRALEPRDTIPAMWEGGSAARGETDRWSDIDAVVVCERGAVEEVFQTAEAALDKFSRLDLVWKVPTPTWHGNAQRFYRFRGAPPHMLVDLVVIERGSHHRFLVPERHGQAVVVFDKEGLIEPADFEADEFRDAMIGRLSELKVRFEMLQCLVDKELERGRLLDAMNAYLGLTLAPLLVVLGIRYRPFRYDFGRRYTREDFPTDVADELERLHFVHDADDLATKRKLAEDLFWHTVETLDLERLDLARMSRKIRSQPAWT